MALSPSIVLSLDTTTRAGSVALLRDDECLAEHAGDAETTHGQRLPGDMMRLLAGAGVSLSAVELLAVAAGPGSFTGLRVGIAAMQGLSMAIGRPIVPVSTLEALARAAGECGRLIVPWVDAQRGQVFSALYDRSGREALIDPVAELPDAALLIIHAAAPHGEPLLFLGDGAVRYRAAISAAFGGRAEIREDVPRLAVWIARIAAAAPDRAVAPHAVAPIYVRRPDAELARDRRAGGG